MKRTILALGASLALSITGVAGVVPTTATAASTTHHVRHWKIKSSAVGPVRLGERLRGLRKAGFAFYPCGGTHHPCYFKGSLGDADLEFDVNRRGRINEIMVNETSGYGYAFATKHGVTADSTVGTLKMREHPTYIGNYGYGDAFQLHKKHTHKWITFFAEGTTSESKLYSIAVSRYSKPPQGR